MVNLSDNSSVEEYSCRHLVYKTVGSTQTDAGFKVYDICHVVGSLVFVIFLLYSLPRTRQKLSGAPFLLNTTHILLHVTSITQIVRCLLMFMAPSPNYDITSSHMEKVTWAITHAVTFCLELTCFLIFMLPVLPSNRSSQRIFCLTAGLAAGYGLLLSTLELTQPSSMFHLDSLDADLYGDGGTIFILFCSLSSAAAYAALISLRVFQKAGSRRSSTFTYSIVMLGIQGTRTLGAILLAANMEFGMCLTNLTFFLLIQFLPPLVFLCVLCPYLHTTQGHSLLTQSTNFTVGMTEEDDWLEDDYDLYTATDPRNDPLGVSR